MLDRFRRLFGKEPRAPSREPDSEFSLAVAGLLVEAARTDESYTDKERKVIERAVAGQFSLSAEEAREAVARAETLQQGASDIHRFTKVAKQMDGMAKEKLIATLWRIVLSDGARTPHEEALIRRVCGLIYVDDAVSGAIRQRVAAELKGAG